MKSKVSGKSRKNLNFANWRKSFATFIAALIAGHVVAETTVLSTVDGGSGFAILGSYALASGWTQTVSYEDVSISAELFVGGPGTITGRAYLMNQIGPGTTAANEVASTSYSLTTSGVNVSEMANLFSGLTLPPSNYYLVIAGADGGWELANLVATTSTAPGVSILNYYDTYPVNGDTSYPPDSDFNPLAPPFGSNQLEYSVTGVLVPEPASLSVLAFGAVGLLLRRYVRQ